MYSEKYVVGYANENHTVRLMKDGTYKCDCKFYSFGNCMHIEALKAGKARIIEAQRKG